MNKSRGGPYFNRSFLNEHNAPLFEHNRPSPSMSDKPSFSSLFTGPMPNPNSSFGVNHQSIMNKSLQKPNIEPFPCEAATPAEDGGVYLQISNLEQWYNETNLRNYLMSQLKPITPILSLTIETPSIAKVKVPSIQVSYSPSEN